MASAAQPLSAAVPGSYDPVEARPFGAAPPQDAAEPAVTAESQAVATEAYGASQAYAVDEPYGAAALDEGDGFYGHYGDYDLDDGRSEALRDRAHRDYRAQRHRWGRCGRRSRCGSRC